MNVINITQTPIPKTCLIMYILSFSDKLGTVLCRSKDLMQLCRKATELRIKQVYQLDVQQYSSQCNSTLYLSDIFKYNNVCRFGQRKDVVDTISFIPWRLNKSLKNMNTDWESQAVCTDNTLYHVHFDCEEHVLSFHQNKSLTGNYLVLTNNLELYKTYFYSSSKEMSNSFLGLDNSQFQNGNFYCELLIKKNVTIQYGTPDVLLMGQAVLQVMSVNIAENFTEDSLPKGSLDATDKDRKITLQFEGETSKPNILILPIKGIHILK